MENKTSMVRWGIIFDFDGTLFDDIQVSQVILKRLQEKFAPTLTSNELKRIEDEILEELSHTGSKGRLIQLMLHAAQRMNVPWWKRLIFLRTSDIIYKEEIQRCSLFPETEGVIKTLTKQSKTLSLGILTTTPMPELKHRLVKDPHFLDYFPQAVITGDRVSQPKPHPEGLLLLADLWHIDPSHLIMIGDMVGDMKAAKQINAIAIGILTGFGDTDTLIQAGADKIINSLSELPEYIQTIISKNK